MAIDSTLRSPLTLRLVAPAVDRTLSTHRPPPDDGPVAVPGPDPLRLLLGGAGTALGYGAATRSEALDGHLASLLARRTGRGVRVETRFDEDLGIDGIAGLLAASGPHVHDAVVWSPTFREVARFRPRRSWARAIGGLVDGLRTDGGSAALVVLGLPEVLTTTSLGDAAVVQLRRLNDRIASAAAEHGAGFIPVPVIRPLVGAGHVLDSFYYARCAAEIVPAVADRVAARGAISV